MHRRFCVPPDPAVMSMLWMNYLRFGKPHGLSFRTYLAVIGYTNAAIDQSGMDDSVHFRSTDAGLERIDIPDQQITGELPIKVLLVDFPDRPGTLDPQHYEDLLFSRRVYPTGSMRDYFREVSLGAVDVTGSVYGWLRMPNPYSFYTNGESGTRWASYPNNAPRMAEDAVKTAVNFNVPFERELDKLGGGVVTALFIIHAGRGAESLPAPLKNHEIWSHKWTLRNPVTVGPGLDSVLYLTVPQTCRLGVCAHELGHLAFQWQDFYDPNYDEDGQEWDGSGNWDLMAGGSYNGSSNTPAHPAGLHKMQHGWIGVEEVTSSTRLTLKPYTHEYGKPARVRSPQFAPTQYLVLENRSRNGFDFGLPGEGLLVWRVDEAAEMEAPGRPGLQLVQADGRHDLETPNDWNQGDAGDPFPGSTNRNELGDVGNISTSFPGGPPSEIKLSNILRDPVTGEITLDVVIGNKPKEGRAERKQSRTRT